MRHTLSFAVICRVLTSLSGMAIAFISLRLYNIYLTKESFGAVLVANQVLSYLPLISGGFGMVLSQKLLSSPDRQTLFKTAHFSQVMQCHIALLAGVAAVVVMTIYVHTPSARATGIPTSVYYGLAAAAVLSFYSAGQIGMLTPLGRQVYSIILVGILGLVGLVVLWISFRLGAGIWAMPISTGLTPLLFLPLAWYLQQRLAPGLTLMSWHRDADFWPRVKDIWAPSLNWLQGQFSIIVLFTMDLILMGMLFGPGPAAVYGIVTRVMTMSRAVIQTLTETAWPRLTQELNLERKADLMRKVDRLSAWLSGSWYGAMAATLQPFLGWLIKSDWVAGSTVILLILARNMIVSFSSAHSYGLLSAGRFKDLARATQLEIVVSLVAILTFSHIFKVYGYGELGLPLGVLVGTSGGSLWFMTYLYFKGSDQPWFREWCAVYLRGISGAVIAFVVASIAWHGEKSLGNIPGWASILAGGVGLAVGMSVAYGFGMMQSAGKTRMLGPLKLPTSW